jgi:4-hydroxybenzoate polyprenyltransferase
MTNFLNKTITYGRMIKFHHTIFALPFALAAIVLARRETPITGYMLFWVIMAMVGARSAAMGFNRLADASLDARNPRTEIRAIPRGTISTGEAFIFVLASALLFMVAAAKLSVLCFWLSFPVLGVLFIYSYTKRFTWLAHIVLGFAIGMAPMAVWVAVNDVISWKIGILSLALLTYIAGFDILYACQDFDFDIKEGLYSIPVRFGISHAMHISTALHILSVICLAGLYWLFHLSPVYLVFVAVIAGLFVVEHSLVHPDDLTRINMAFFHVNSIISLLVFAAVLAGDLLKGVI